MTGPHENSSNLAPDQEALVAYLDGELDAAGTRQVEERLAHDGVYRQLLQELQQSWDLLDELPQTVPDKALTRTTVEMVALQAAAEVQQEQPRATRQRRWRQALAAAVAATALLLGFVGIRAWLDRPNRQLLRDLPVIERVDLYQYVDDVTFLEKLNEEGLFDEDVDPSQARDSLRIARCGLCCGLWLSLGLAVRRTIRSPPAAIKSNNSRRNRSWNYSRRKQGLRV